MLAPLLPQLALDVKRLPMKRRRWWRRVAEVVVEEYAAARKSRPIFQRRAITTERPSDHLKYLVAGRKLSDPGTETCWRNHKDGGLRKLVCSANIQSTYRLDSHSTTCPISFVLNRIPCWTIFFSKLWLEFDNRLNSMIERWRNIYIYFFSSQEI